VIRGESGLFYIGNNHILIACSLDHISEPKTRKTSILATTMTQRISRFQSRRDLVSSPRSKMAIEKKSDFSNEHLRVNYNIIYSCLATFTGAEQLFPVERTEIGFRIQSLCSTLQHLSADACHK
jgi:hypothetical protein